MKKLHFSCAADLHITALEQAIVTMQIESGDERLFFVVYVPEHVIYHYNDIRDHCLRAGKEILFVRHKFSNPNLWKIVAFRTETYEAVSIIESGIV